MMRKIALGCLLLAAASVASATTTFIAQGTSSGGNSVYAEADFTFSNNLLTLTLTNLLVNPANAAQNISDFEFTIASLSGTTATLTPYTGASTNTKAPQLVTITGPGYTVTSNGSAGYDPGWAFAYSSGNFALDALAGSVNGPAYTIVGPPGASGYTNANSSLTNGAHNPMIYQSATWVFNVVNPGGSVLNITNVNFSFGTTAGNDYTCDASHNFCAAVPEPGSWLLLGSGLAVLLFFARKRTA